MPSLRTLALQGFDTVAGAFQNAFQSYGLLSDNREAVAERSTSHGRIAGLPDKSDEGWPAVEFALPADATFQQASSGVLSRAAVWSTTQPASEVEALVAGQVPEGQPGFVRGADAATLQCNELGAVVRIRSGPDRILLIVRQRRNRDAVAEALRAKVGRR